MRIGMITSNLHVHCVTFLLSSDAIQNLQESEVPTNHGKKIGLRMIFIHGAILPLAYSLRCSFVNTEKKQLCVQRFFLLPPKKKMEGEGGVDIEPLPDQEMAPEATSGEFVVAIVFVF